MLTKKKTSKTIGQNKGRTATQKKTANTRGPDNDTNDDDPRAPHDDGKVQL